MHPGWTGLGLCDMLGCPLACILLGRGGWIDFLPANEVKRRVNEQRNGSEDERGRVEGREGNGPAPLLAGRGTFFLSTDSLSCQPGQESRTPVAMARSSITSSGFGGALNALQIVPNLD